MTRLGSLPQAVGEHLARSAGMSAWATVAALPGFFRKRWQVQRARQLPAEAGGAPFEPSFEDGQAQATARTAGPAGVSPPLPWLPFLEVRRARPVRGQSSAMRRAALTLVLGAAAIFAGAAHAATKSPRPVSTLTPHATAQVWRALVARPQPAARAAGCRPLRGIFYAATDWLRLATKLAANGSSCAQYYISIPPLVSDKTKARPDQAWRIRALGGNFHAMAEIHFTTWMRWVASNGTTWYAAGVEARHRMEAAGFDVTKGDTWAVNELPSSVRTNTGPWRQNVRDFVHGLYAGDGTPPTKGIVFVIGPGQSLADVSLYQSNVQNWLTDSAFWTDMSAYVSDWSQEVYGDVRRALVPGAIPDQRRDYLVDYLEHLSILSGVGPPTVDAARAFLAAAYSPLGNAAWQWTSAYGYTNVTFDLMQSFVSNQVYALRSYGLQAGLPQDHFGFAWQPRNGAGLATADFNARAPRSSTGSAPRSATRRTQQPPRAGAAERAASATCPARRSTSRGSRSARGRRRRSRSRPRRRRSPRARRRARSRSRC